MIFTMQLTADDYLAYHLYTAAHSPQIVASRKRNRIIMLAAFILLSYSFYSKNEWVYMGIYCSVGVLAFFLYPLYFRWYYGRRIKKHIHQKFANAFGTPVTLTFEEEKLMVKDETGETEMQYEALDEVNEIQSCYFLRMDNGQALIVPKHALNDQMAFDTLLQEIITRFEIYHSRDLNWQWK